MNGTLALTTNQYLPLGIGKKKIAGVVLDWHGGSENISNGHQPGFAMNWGGASNSTTDGLIDLKLERMNL